MRSFIKTSSIQLAIAATANALNARQSSRSGIFDCTIAQFFDTRAESYYSLSLRLRLGAFHFPACIVFLCRRAGKSICIKGFQLCAAQNGRWQIHSPTATKALVALTDCSGRYPANHLSSFLCVRDEFDEERVTRPRCKPGFLFLFFFLFFFSLSLV